MQPRTGCRDRLKELRVHRLLGFAIASVVVIGGASAASARDGCGAGLHRGPAGHCRPNRAGAVVVVRPVIGNFYVHRGYWDGHRYRQHRYRHRGHWRYR